MAFNIIKMGTGLQGLIIQVEGGDAIRLDVNAIGELPIAKINSGSFHHQVDYIFGLQQPSVSASVKKALCNHRLLTSDEVFSTKVTQKAQRRKGKTGKERESWRKKKS